MSTALPTHEVVAVFPAEIKAGVLHMPVRMHGSKQLLIATKAVAIHLLGSLLATGLVAPAPASVAELPLEKAKRPYVKRYAGKPTRWAKIRAIRDALAANQGNVRELADAHDLDLTTVYRGLKLLEEGNAPFPEQDKKRPPISKPNGKLL